MQPADCWLQLLMEKHDHWKNCDYMEKVEKEWLIVKSYLIVQDIDLEAR